MAAILLNQANNASEQGVFHRQSVGLDFPTREQNEGLPQAFDTAQGDKGVRYKNVRASYIHWYFAETNNQSINWFNVVN
jgi:cobyrinic acid a,c-diamide synthase